MSAGCSQCIRTRLESMYLVVVVARRCRTASSSSVRSMAALGSDLADLFLGTVGEVSWVVGSVVSHVELLGSEVNKVQK